LVWTRGNRSSRFFNHVVDSLAAPSHSLRGSFQAQMFAAFMMREHAAELAEHLAYPL
jgi:hypothetical protein